MGLEGRLTMLAAKFRKGENQEKQVREKEGSLSHRVQACKITRFKKYVGGNCRKCRCLL